MREREDADRADDKVVRELLQSAATAPPVADVDWAALHARIIARAKPLLARDRTAWWQVAADWSERGVPLAAAAAVLLLMLGRMLPGEAAAASRGGFITIEEELAGAAPAFAVAAGDADDVLDALLFHQEE